jgi:hypothetical protein
MEPLTELGQFRPANDTDVRLFSELEIPLPRRVVCRNRWGYSALLDFDSVLEAP